MINIDNLTVAAVIIALVKAAKEHFPQVNGLVTMGLAVVLGALAGYLGLEGLTVQTGIMAGLTATGIHTVVRAVRE